MIPTLASSILLVCVLPGLPFQDSDEPPQSDLTEASLMAEGWEPVDGIASQIGSEVITWRSLENTRRAMNPDTPPLQALENLRWTSLMVQAGEDIGVGNTRIDRLVSQEQDDLRAQQGSRVYAEFLAENGIDAQQVRISETRRKHREFWILIQRGDLGPGGERPIRDPYVRPGTLRSLNRMRHEQLKNSLGAPDEVRFQALVVAEAMVGGLEPAKTFAEELVQRARDGEDFSALIAEYSAVRQNQGLSDWYDPARLSNPTVQALGRTGEVGAISDPIPLMDPENPTKQVGYRILRLHERREGRPAPPFFHRDTQGWLRGDYGANWRDAIFTREIRMLESRTYLWIHPELQALAPAPEAGESGS